MSVVSFLAVCLASVAVLNVWRQGSLFASWRLLIELRLELGENQSPAFAADSDITYLEYLVGNRLPLWLAELLNCDFCLSYHVPAWLLGWPILGEYVWPWSQTLWLLPIHSLAATTVIRILTHMSTERTKTSYARETDN